MYVYMIYVYVCTYDICVYVIICTYMFIYPEVIKRGLLANHPCVIGSTMLRAIKSINLQLAALDLPKGIYDYL